MSKRTIRFIAVALMTLWLVACGNSVTPTPASKLPNPTATEATAANIETIQASKSPRSGFETKSHSGGSVDVDVTPQTLSGGQAMAFQIGMNTHSVDLIDDLTKIVVVRDDAGKVYTPTAWDGSAPGGHHRSGTLKFAALANKSKYVELVIQNLSNVPERKFRWDIP